MTEIATTAETAKTVKPSQSSLGTVFVGQAKGGQGALHSRQNLKTAKTVMKAPALNPDPLFLGLFENTKENVKHL